MAPEEIAGDLGETRGDGNTPRHDGEHRILTRLQKRKDWVVPNRSWESAPEFLQTFLENDKNDVRERISSARTLVMMSNSTVAAQSVEVRINQAIAVTTPPAAPEDVDIEVQPAFIESVIADDLEETVGVLESLGLLERYVEQVKTQTTIPSGNGNTSSRGNLDGHTKGNGKP